MKKQITLFLLLITLLFGANYTTVHADDEDIPSPTVKATNS